MNVKNKYDRSFLIFLPETSGYVIDGQKLAGTVILELRNGKGRVTANISGLKPISHAIYKMYLITAKNKNSIGIPARVIEPDTKGKASATWDFDPVSISGSGIDYFSINVIAIVAKSVSQTQQELAAPLVAYKDGPQIWKGTFIEWDANQPPNSPVQKSNLSVEANCESIDINENEEKEDEALLEITEAAENPISADEHIPLTTEEENTVEIKEESAALNQEQDESEKAENLGTDADLPQDSDTLEDTLETFESDTTNIETSSDKVSPLNFYEFNSAGNFDKTAYISDALINMFEKRQYASPFDMPVNGRPPYYKEPHGGRLDKAPRHKDEWPRANRPFSGVKWIKIDQNDFVYLPEGIVKYMNIPFVSLPYKRYSHFLLGINRQIGRTKLYFGVPGQYSSRDKYRAAELGFNEFMPVGGGFPHEGEFGYWIMTVNY